MRKNEKIVEEIINDEIKKIPNNSLVMFLSGGLDSSLILALLRKSKPTVKIKTYTYAKDINHPDILYARKISKQFNTEHTEIFLTNKLFNEYQKEFDKIKKYNYEGDIYWYILSKNVEEYSNIITGDGGDECFGGYFLHKYPLGHKETGEITSFEQISIYTQEHIKEMFNNKFRNFLFKEKSVEQDYNDVWEYYINTLIPQQVKPLTYMEEIFNIKFYLPLCSEKLIEFMRNVSYINRIDKNIERNIANKYLSKDIINRKKFNLKGYDAR
jgi:asparagine synthetase B (glutamine-hydrolysing)